MNKIQKAIQIALDEINQFEPPEKQILSSSEEIIIGNNGILDSLSTATFLIELENAYFQLSGNNVDFAELVISDEGLAKNFTLKDIENLVENEK